MEEDKRVLSASGELPAPAHSQGDSRVRRLIRRMVTKVSTKEGLIGEYNYSYLFTPRIPFITKTPTEPPFFGLNDRMPVLLGFLLGLQHALSMLAGIVSPPIIISASANLSVEMQQYLVSASLIASGILSTIQITRFHIWRTKYNLGTGLLSVVGTSFATITLVSAVFPQMYSNGYCPTADDGTKLPCPDGYGAILGTAAVCGLLEILMSFIPPKYLQKLFPPVVTGPVVLLIGLHLVESGFKDWAGGSGDCSARPESGMYSMCPTINAPHPLPWGSAEFIGLGFLVFVTIVLCELWGAPIMKSCAVIVGLIVGSIVAAGVGYFDSSSIDLAPGITFTWVKTFRLSVYGPAVLPMLSVYITCAMEAIGDITATCEVSKQEVDGPIYDSRIQGGVLADGCNSIIAALMTMTPMSTFAQNNGVIALTKCANRTAGYWCCFFLILMGVVAKFAAALVAIPKAVLGGMTTFLFASVVVSGIKIITTIPFTRKDRFVLTCSLLFGLGATLVPDWFSYVFTYNGDNNALQGLLDAIQIVMETGYTIAGIVGVIINSILSDPETSSTAPYECDIPHEEYSITENKNVSH